jgi:hypothetical protein
MSITQTTPLICIIPRRNTRRAKNINIFWPYYKHKELLIAILVFLKQEIIKMTAAINVFNFDSPFPYVLILSTALTILSLASVYLTSSLILH